MNPKWFICAILITATLLGAVMRYLQYLHNENGVQILLLNARWFVLILTYFWFVCDRSLRNYTGSALLMLTVIILPFIGIPYYLFRSRPIGHRLIALSWLAGIMVLFLVAVFLGSFIVGINLHNIGGAPT